MKNKLTKLLATTLIVFAGIAISPIFTSKVLSASEKCPFLNEEDPIEVGVTAPGDRNDGVDPKVMPGESIKVKVTNKCKTSDIVLNIYVHPASITKITDTNITPYLKVTDYWIVTDKEDTIDIPIDGSGGAGAYKVRVVSYERGVGGIKENLIGTVNKDLTISSEGIDIIGPDSIKKNDPANYEIKFYSHLKETFSLYVDGDTGLKYKDLPIPSDPYTYSWSWDNSGTETGAHTIIISVQTSHGERRFEKNIILLASDGTDTSSSASTFSITKLNSFNIKNLLNSCSSKPDLGGIICMVEALIAWLLDIGMVISFIMILYAAAMYLTSYGEESKAELAKKTLIWSVIGVLVILAAKGIMLIIQNIMNNPSSLG